MTTTTHSHGLDTLAGYVVRRTYFDGREHVDVAEFAANAYGEAVDRAKVIRLEADHDGYAVVDPIYACGCRGRG